MLTKEAIQELQHAPAITEARITMMASSGPDARAAALPDHFTLHDLEKFFPTRRRPRGTMATHTVADFAAYVLQQAQEGTTVFIDQEKMRAEAVLNLGSPATPGHADDVAQLRPRATAAYSELLKHANGNGLHQRAAAEFLEDWQPNIELLKDAQRVSTPLGIEAVRSITIEAQRKGTSVEQNLGATRSTFESVQASSEKPLPTHIYFKCVPYHGLQERVFVLRLGVITGDKPAVVLRIVGKEQHEEEMAAELAAQVREALPKMPVLLGAYTPKA